MFCSWTPTTIFTKKPARFFCEQLQEGMDILVGDAVQIQGDEEVEMSHVEIPSDSVLTGKEFMKIQLKADKMYMTAWLHLHRRDFLIENELFFKKGILHEDQQWTPRVFLKSSKSQVRKIPFLLLRSSKRLHHEEEEPKEKRNRFGKNLLRA
jgi:hypothetical protein